MTMFAAGPEAGKTSRWDRQDSEIQAGMHVRIGRNMARRAVGTLRASLSAVLILAPGVALSEPSIGQFELKDLEAEPGEVEFQSQNAYAIGQPRRKFAEEAPGEFAYDENSVTRQRHALEIEMSMTSWLRTRVGIEYEKERFDDPPSPAAADAYAPLELTEVALEGVVILRPVSDNGLGFGLLAEFEHPLAKGEMNKIIVGPIIGARSGPWEALLNLMLVHHFGAGERDDDGVERDDKWDFAYAAQVKYEIDTTWSLALEAYGTFDRLGKTGEPGESAVLFGDHDQHRAGPIVYYERKVGGGGKGDDKDDDKPRASGVRAVESTDRDGDVTVRLGTGVLLGLNDNTPDATLKASLEVEF